MRAGVSGSFAGSGTRSIPVRDGPVLGKNLSEIHLTRARRASRQWFRDLLWRAFPASSDNDRAAQAARVLGVSARQVSNWLACRHDAPLTMVCTVMVIAGCEVVFRQIEGRAEAPMQIEGRR